MSFPRKSAFDQGAGVPPKPEPPTHVHYVGRPNTVEVPLEALERWSNACETLTMMHMSKETEADLQTLADEVRSYFRG